MIIATKTPFAALMFTLTLGDWYRDNDFSDYSLLLYQSNQKYACMLPSLNKFKRSLYIKN